MRVLNSLSFPAPMSWAALLALSNSACSSGSSDLPSFCLRISLEPSERAYDLTVFLAS